MKGNHACHNKLVPDTQVTLYDTTGGIIDPMTGDLLAKLPSLGTDIHFEARYTATYAPLMMSYEDGYTVVELLIVGEAALSDSPFLSGLHKGVCTSPVEVCITQRGHTTRYMRNAEPGNCFGKPAWMCHSWVKWCVGVT